MAISDLGTSVPSKTAPNPFAAKLVGKPAAANKAKGKAQSLRARLQSPRAVNVMLFGDWATGKTYTVVDLLKLGFKVYFLNTDFAQSGTKTIENALVNMMTKDPNFKDEWLDNLQIYEPTTVAETMEFVRNPADIMPDFWEWGPDVLFWDGMTSFQQTYIEAELVADDFVRVESEDWTMWRKTKNETMYPLMAFLQLENPNGKPLHKIVTMLQKETAKYKQTGSGKDAKRDVVPGTEYIAPMLHTSVKDIAGAGFDVILQTYRRVIGDNTLFEYRNMSGMLTKDRGFGIPAKVENASFTLLWKTYLEPKLTSFGAPSL